MAILPGSDRLWESTFHDFLEAIRVQLGYDYYFGSVTSAVAILFIAPITILGNVLVISAFYKDPNKDLRSAPSYILLTSLALSDFIVGAVQTPLTAYYWIDSFVAERFPFSFTYLLSVNGFIGTVSMLHLLALSIDRFLAVVTPLKYASTVTKNRTYIVAAFIWSYSLVVGCISAALGKIISSGTLLAVHIVIPCCCMTYLNSRIIIQMRRASREVNSSVIDDQFKIYQKRERKVVKLVFLVLGVFVMCYLPWFITLILALTCSICKLKALMYAYAVSGILLYVSPLIHPFLYTWRLPRFKKALLSYFKPHTTLSPVNSKTLNYLRSGSENKCYVTDVDTKTINTRV